jgi:hypothetical protein
MAKFKVGDTAYLGAGGILARVTDIQEGWYSMVAMEDGLRRKKGDAFRWEIVLEGMMVAEDRLPNQPTEIVYRNNLTKSTNLQK